MAMGMVLMAERELHRVGVLTEIINDNRSIASGAALLGITPRHMRRLIDRYRAAGASAFAHGHRGRPSNRCRDISDRERAIALVREHYQGYGLTLAAEKLLERHDLLVPRETLRGWMADAGLWLTRTQRRRFHQIRQRRHHLGELIQVDGSHHY